MVHILATIFYEKRFWVGTFERTDKEGYAVARHIFGPEPTDPEVHDFILNHYHELNFGAKQEFTLTVKRKNPKRIQREIRKEMEKLKETSRPSTFAQDYMREELEKKKAEKKRITSQQKEVRRKEQFALKQEKKKQKKRGN